jgi:hypothetical protein
MTHFENGDAETLLAFIHDFRESIQLKGVNDNYECPNCEAAVTGIFP